MRLCTNSSSLNVISPQTQIHPDMRVISQPAAPPTMRLALIAMIAALDALQISLEEEEECPDSGTNNAVSWHCVLGPSFRTACPSRPGAGASCGGCGVFFAFIALIAALAPGRRSAASSPCVGKAMLSALWRWVWLSGGQSILM